MQNLMGPLRAWMSAHPGLVANFSLAGVVVLLGFQTRRLVRMWRAPVSARQRQLIASSTRPGLSEKTPLQRLRAGALVGLIFPGVFSLFFLFSLIADGRYQTDSHHTPEDELVAFVGYLVGSVALVGIVTLGWPWMRRLVTALMVGWAASIPITVGIIASQDNHFAHWTTAATQESLGFSLFFGVMFGIIGRHTAAKVEAARQGVLTSADS